MVCQFITRLVAVSKLSFDEFWGYLKILTLKKKSLKNCRDIVKGRGELFFVGKSEVLRSLCCFSRIL